MISVALFFPKIYRCEITILELEYQVLSYTEMQFLASNVQKCSLRWIVVKNEDGTIVSFEKIIELFPRLLELKCSFDERLSINISKNTVTNLLKIPQFLQLKFLRLSRVPETFDMPTFYNYHKMRKSKCEVLIAFKRQLSQHFVNNLKSIVDDILQNSLKMAPIFFQFDELTRQQIFLLSLLYNFLRENGWE
uniref:Uncharacterized protein n=1 Tax=Panagrolaimus sp. ES5 TaxID=591445 RepID=A0AC34G8Z6_9BILA